MLDGAQRSICCFSLKTNKKHILRSAQDDMLGGFSAASSSFMGVSRGVGSLTRLGSKEYLNLLSHIGRRPERPAQPGRQSMPPPPMPLALVITRKRSNCSSRTSSSSVSGWLAVAQFRIRRRLVPPGPCHLLHRLRCGTVLGAEDGDQVALPPAKLARVLPRARSCRSACSERRSRRRAFRATRRFPAAIRGPVDLRALRRLAVMRSGLAVPAIVFGEDIRFDLYPVQSTMLAAS